MDVSRLGKELLLALLQTDGVDYRLALYALQSCLQYLPLGGVYHHRHACYLWLRGYEVEERRHGIYAVNKTVVHTDVYDVCAVVHLVTCYGQRSLIVLRLNELLELSRTSHVGALANIIERRFFLLNPFTLLPFLFLLFSLPASLVGSNIVAAILMFHPQCLQS